MKLSCLFVFILSSFIFGNAFANNLRERVYLQTDKQTYLAGELLWVKLYLTDAEGVPGTFSKVGYIELSDGNAAQLQIKVDLTDGIGTGCIELPATLASGYYQLIGYTRQMRNEGESVFFNKTISIVNTFRADSHIKTDTDTALRSHPSAETNIVLLTDGNNFKTRSHQEVYLQGLPDNIHSLCLTVSGKDLIPESFTIDQWKKVLPHIPLLPVKTDFIPEYEGHIIPGKIVNIMTDEFVHSADHVIPFIGFTGDQIRLFNGKTGKDGSVHFFTNRIAGRKEVATSVLSSSNNKYIVNILSPFQVHSKKELPVIAIDPDWQDQLLHRSIGLQASYAYIADSLNLTDSTFAHFQWIPDRSYILDEYTRFTRMDEVVIEFIPSLRFRKIDDRRILSVLMEENATFSIGNTLVLLDGIPIFDHDMIYNYDPLLVYKIDVYKNRFIFGNQFFDGIVFFTTYKHDYPTLKVDEQTQIFDYDGTQAHRHFYVPSYDDEKAIKSRIPDYRHTLLWQPNIKTAGLSNISIPFTTSDLTGVFQVVAEGITRDGKIVRGITYFTVSE